MERKTIRRGMLVILVTTAAWLVAGTLTAQTPQDWVQAHNAYRSSADCGSADLKWSPEMAALAKKWATKIAKGKVTGHRPQSQFAGKCDFNYCGENIYQSSGGGAPGVAAVAAWHDSEKADYDRDNRRCTAMCGHYTQVVSWRSQEVGCANANQAATWVTVCNYRQGGNMVDRDGVYREAICPNHPGGQTGGGQTGGGQPGGGQTGDGQAGGGQAGGNTFSAQDLLAAINAEHGTSLAWNDALAQAAEAMANGQPSGDVGFARACAAGLGADAAATARAMNVASCLDDKSGKNAGIFIGTIVAFGMDGYYMAVR